MKSEEDEGSLRDRLDQELRKAQSELAKSSVEATAGRGAVKITMSGTQECLRVEITRDILDSGDARQLEGLVLLAVNQAIRDSQLMAARRLSPFSGDLVP
ncbi:MAG: YbaB/EbfC family nucleoid-associated protein [Anaerolineales bacterium]